MSDSMLVVSKKPHTSVSLICQQKVCVRVREKERESVCTKKNYSNEGPVSAAPPVSPRSADYSLFR